MLTLTDPGLKLHVVQVDTVKTICKFLILTTCLRKREHIFNAIINHNYKKHIAIFNAITITNL